MNQTIVNRQSSARLLKSSAKISVLFTLGWMVSACVSDTLSSTNTTPQPQPLAASQEVPDYDPVQREQALQEIRAKAAQPGSGQLTNPYVTNDSPNSPFTAQEQAVKIQELQNTANQNNAVATDAELAEKQRSIHELQQKAQSHYGNAVNQIKN